MPAHIAIVSFPGPEANALEQELRAAPPESATALLTRSMARGCEAAFARFFELYCDRLLRYLLVMTRGDESTARDALQDTMTRIAKHVRRFDDERAFWDWLAVLARSAARSAARDGGRKQVRYFSLLTRFIQSGAAEPPAATATPAEELLNEALERAMNQIPPRERELLAQKYYHGASVREIAQRSALTEKAVEARLLRARRKLREELNRTLGDEI